MLSDDMNNWKRSLRKDANENCGVLLFSPLPLFVALAYRLDPNLIQEQYNKASQDSATDPDEAPDFEPDVSQMAT